MVVSGALKTLSGATLKKVVPGEAEIELSGTTKDSVIDIIEKAGYTVSNK